MKAKRESKARAPFAAPPAEFFRMRAISFGAEIARSHFAHIALAWTLGIALGAALQGVLG